MKKPTLDDTIDPYRPVDLEPTPRSPAASRRAELTLKFVTVVVVLLSLIGILMGLSEFGFAVVPGGKLLTGKANTTGNAEIDAALEVWQGGMLHVRAKYLVVSGALGLIGVAVGVLGCLAGFFILRTPRRHRLLLQYACLAAIGFELLAIFPALMMRWELLTVADAVAQQVSSGTGRTVVESIARGGTIGAMFIAMLFMFVKSGFYLYGVFVVRRPETIRLFSDEPHPPVETDEPIPAQLA